MPNNHVVTYNPKGDLDALLQSAHLAYELSPHFRVEFPNKLDFIKLLESEWSGLPTLCVHDLVGNYCGGLLLSPPSQDMHIAGTGRYVLHAVVVPGKPQLLPLLLNKLRHMIVDEGGSWYHINKQTGLRTNQGRYRRLIWAAAE